MQASTRRRGSAAVFVLLLMAALPAGANGNPLFALQTQWWQWAGSIPIEVNPLVDETGKYCDAGQRGGYWFLASNFGGRTTRECTVPKGVKLVVPIIVTFCYPEEGYDDDTSCIHYVNDILAGYRRQDLTIKLDDAWQETQDICEIVAAPGDAVPPVPRHCLVRRRADRTLFNFVIGSSGFYASDPGAWRANAARGVWAVIDTSKLPAGKHLLKIRAVGKPGAAIPFLAVTYRLHVEKPAN
jgi:hypothetical protein